eukprot:COSAG05_NODE_25295_length_198_cov_20.181818_1_plen_65_part_11
MAGIGAIARLDCTAARYDELLSVMLELSTDSDFVFAGGALWSPAWPLIASGAQCAGVIAASQETP